VWLRCAAAAGKYVLRQGAVTGQATITVQAQERLFPNRAAVCRFFVEAGDYNRERRALDRVPAGVHTPGERAAHCCPSSHL
jgi:hypothetical protein